MKTRTLAILAVASFFLSFQASARENSVVGWNSVALEAFAPSQGTNPMAQSRTLAIMHAAIYDAVNAVDPRYPAYTNGVIATRGASLDAAVAAAARDVLVALVPEQSALVESAYGRALDKIAAGPARTSGIATGQLAARLTLARRQGDGLETAAQPKYVPGSAPGDYQLTPPFDFAAQPGWGRVKPFVIDLHDHALPGPQKLSSPDFARDIAYVRAIGEMNSKTRSREQTDIARFWYEDSPLGWNRIANAVIRDRGVDTSSAARAFALVNFALADAFIAGFDAKYHFNFWRPVTAIHSAEANANWQPLMPTPPVPDYPSTHTSLGWAAAEVLIALFGDDVKFEMTSLTLPGTTRRFKGFSAAAEENGLSRIYAGIHFQHAVKDGRRQGRSVGRAVANALPPAKQYAKR